MSTPQQQSKGWAERAGYQIGPAATRPNASAERPEKETYRAAVPQDRAASIWIHPKNGEWEIVTSWPLTAKLAQPDMMLIKTSTHAITIHGRNLHEIGRLLASGRCAELHEFDPEAHDEPEADQPKIFTIELHEVKEMP